MSEFEQLKSMLDELKKILMQNTKQTLTIDEAAQFLGLKRAYIYKLTSTKRIPHYKNDLGKVYFDRKELEQWQKRHKVDSIDESACKTFPITANL